MAQVWADISRWCHDEDGDQPCRLTLLIQHGYSVILLSSGFLFVLNIFHSFCHIKMPLGHLDVTLGYVLLSVLCFHWKIIIFILIVIWLTTISSMILIIDN
jgi:hypothetical protein